MGRANLDHEVEMAIIESEQNPRSEPTSDSSEDREGAAKEEAQDALEARALMKDLETGDALSRLIKGEVKLEQAIKILAIIRGKEKLLPSPISRTHMRTDVFPQTTDGVLEYLQLFPRNDIQKHQQLIDTLRGKDIRRTGDEDYLD